MYGMGKLTAFHRLRGPQTHWLFCISGKFLSVVQRQLSYPNGVPLVASNSHCWNWHGLVWCSLLEMSWNPCVMQGFTGGLPDLVSSDAISWLKRVLVGDLLCSSHHKATEVGTVDGESKPSQSSVQTIVKEGTTFKWGNWLKRQPSPPQAKT